MAVVPDGRGVRPVLAGEGPRVAGHRRLAVGVETRIERALVLSLIIVVGVDVAALPMDVRTAVHLLAIELVELLAVFGVIVLALLIGGGLSLGLHVVIIIWEVLLGHPIGSLRDTVDYADV